MQDTVPAGGLYLPRARGPPDGKRCQVRRAYYGAMTSEDRRRVTLVVLKDAKGNDQWRTIFSGDSQAGQPATRRRPRVFAGAQSVGNAPVAGHRTTDQSADTESQTVAGTDPPTAKGGE
jgi:hypothetical protein